MIPTPCAASLLPLHLYREGTHAESDTAFPLFFRKPSEEMQPAASSLATHCNGQRSGLQRKGQRHERTAALIHYIYRSAEQRTAKRQDTGTKAWLLSDYMLTFALKSILMRNITNLKKTICRDEKEQINDCRVLLGNGSELGNDSLRQWRKGAR